MIEKEPEEIRLPQPRHAIGFLISMVATIFFFGLLVILLIKALGIDVQTDTQAFLILEVILQALLTLGVIWIFLHFGRFDAKATLSLRPCNLKVYLWAILSVIALGLVTSQLLTYLVREFPQLLSEGLLEQVRLSRFTEPGIYLLYLIVLSLGPGLSEELAFRGFILRGLSARFSPVGAITLTALLFAILHLDLLQILGVFPFGLYAGYLVVRTGSLYPAIVSHAVTNLASTVEGSLWLAYNPQAYQSEEALRDLVINMTYPPVVFAGAIILLAVGLYALHRTTGG